MNETIYPRSQAKYLLKCFSVLCAEMRQTSSGFFISTAAIALLFLPGAVFAQIIISEFLYDAKGADTNQEYVELFNAGTSAIDLTTWRVNDGSNHLFNVPPKNGGTGSITIQSGGYVLLVDNAADFIALHSGISASIIDTVLSLQNAGGSIALIDDTGATADSVSYTKDQGAAGDGNSLTRVSISGAFTAATPTPGNGSLISSGSGSGGTSGSSGTGAATTTGDSFVMPPPPKVFADGGSDRTVIVGADTEFRARAYDQKKNLIDFSHFHWNFGDGSTAETATVLHHFDYPGRYIVVLDIPEEKNSVSDQVTVTVEPMKLALSLLSDGSVAIENRAGRTLDLSRWIVRSLGRTFTIPEHTFILANTTLRISQGTLGFTSGSDVELDYPNGVFALGVAPAPVSTSTSTGASTYTPAPVASKSAYRPTAIINEKVATQAVSSDAKNVPELDTATTTYAGPAQGAAAGIGTTSSSRLWWLGAFGIAALAAGSLTLARRFRKKEWDIEEIGETR